MNHRFIILLCCVLVSCNTSKKIVYLQDATNGATERININSGIVIQPKDMLTIVVSSRKSELAAEFNLPLVTSFAGSDILASGTYQKILGYVVDMDGSIDFPILGKLHVAGQTRHQLTEMIKQKLIQDDLIKDPVITIEIQNFKISVLGEVALPGTFSVSGDRITILEALGMAHDLTIYGNRDNVLVRREKDNLVTFHRVDLRSESLLHSPVYYLQQNDVVYVEPNKVRAGQSRINANRSVGVWLSLGSLLASLAVLFVK